jgi:hypothetical protein
MHALERLLEQRQEQLFKLLAVELQFHVLRHTVQLDEVLFAHHGMRLEAQPLPRLLGGPDDAAHGPAIGVDGALQVARQPGQDRVHHQAIEVVAAEVIVAVRRQHLGDVVVDAHQRHVERPAAEVVDQHGAGPAAARAVRERGSRGLIEDAHHLQAGDRARIARGLTLAIGKVRRHGDDRALHGRAELPLGALLERTQNHRRHLGRRVGRAVAHRDRVVAAHEAFDRFDSPLRIDHVLIAGWRADDQLSVRGQAGV